MKKIILAIMIAWDFSLHLAELLNIQDYYFLYPIWPTREFYTVFWTIFWGIGLYIILTLKERKTMLELNKAGKHDPGRR
jgi:hypothetical protein